MSVFFKNTCQYNNCRRNFYALKDLIVHIETDHLDFDPHRIEQLEEERPECLPLSYVLKFGAADDSPARCPCKNEILRLNETVIKESDEVSTRNEVVTPFNNNYLGCDLKEKKASLKCFKSNELRLKEEIPTHILGYERFLSDHGVSQLNSSGHKMFTLDHSHRKPFGCNMPGCEKRYKNVNGIKYHYKNYHKIHAPAFKKSLLKCRSILNHSKSKVERRDLHGIPLLSFQSQRFTQMPSELVYHNVQSMTRCEEPEGLPSEYYYKMPTSTDFHVSNQVPLPNMSFNYYNVSDLNGDIEDFSGKNSANFFVPGFDKL